MKSLTTSFSQIVFYNPNQFSNLFDYLNDALFILTEDDEVYLINGIGVDITKSEVLYKCSKGDNTGVIISEKDVKRVNHIFYLFDVCFVDLSNYPNNREILSTSKKMDYMTLLTRIKDLINKLEKKYPYYFSLDLYLPEENKPRINLYIEPSQRKITINYLEEV